MWTTLTQSVSFCGLLLIPLLPPSVAELVRGCVIVYGRLLAHDTRVCTLWCVYAYRTYGPSSTSDESTRRLYRCLC